ncbi:MAG: sporulation sigma factor SigK [Paenibacillus sp.]|nr:sporulation sigma factor SigK [Paenibacillus sp.]
MSLHDPIGTDKEGNEITLIDILGTEADDVVDKVQLKIEKSKNYRNLEILDDREKEVVVGRFGLELGGEERTQREIAKELGISRSYVSRIEKRALMKLYHWNQWIYWIVRSIFHLSYLVASSSVLLLRERWQEILRSFWRMNPRER